MWSLKQLQRCNKQNYILIILFDSENEEYSSEIDHLSLNQVSK